MKQKWQTILLVAVVFLYATSLAFAEGGKVRQQKQNRNGTSSSYQMTLDNEMMLSATQKRTKTRSKDGSCQTSSIATDGNMMLAANGNGNGGSGDNGGNGPGDGSCDGTGPNGNGLGDGTGSAPGDGTGNGPGEAGHGAGPGTGDCKA